MQKIINNKIEENESTDRGSYQQEAVLYFDGHTSRDVFCFRPSFMGECYFDSLFQNRVRSDHSPAVLFRDFRFHIAYFVMAIPSGLLLDKVGYKRGVMYGFMFMSLGALIFVPAALARQYWIFLAGLYCLGTGLAILQTAANPYVTIIGPIGSAARRMSIMGIFNKSAGIVAPLIFAAVVFRATDDANFALLESGVMGEMEKNLYLNELIRRVIHRT